MADIPPGIDLSANQGPRLVGSMITLILLPTLFVIARLVSRKVARAGYWWDDLFVLIACVSIARCHGINLYNAKDIN